MTGALFNIVMDLLIGLVAWCLGYKMGLEYVDKKAAKHRIVKPDAVNAWAQAKSNKEDKL